MSVYIKGMEMPKSCLGCSCTDTEYGECVLDPEKRCPEDYSKRADWCPLVPVPEHGDLIDRDALMKILSKVIDINASIDQRNEATDQERRCLWWFEQQIGIAPTIIPAEEVDNG